MRLFTACLVFLSLCLLGVGCDRAPEQRPQKTGPEAWQADLDAMCEVAAELRDFEPVEDRARTWATRVDERLETESVKSIYAGLPALPRELRYEQTRRGAQGLGFEDWQCADLEAFWASTATPPQ